jgi:hypothetical protein
MPNSPASNRDQAPTAPQSSFANLDQQYRAIGISAVAAAVRFRAEPGRPAEAPATARDRADSQKL